MLLDVLEPNGVAEDLLMFVRHNLELGRQLEFLSVYLKNSFEDFADGTVALSNGWFQESLYLLIALTYGDAAREVT